MLIDMKRTVSIKWGTYTAQAQNIYGYFNANFLSRIPLHINDDHRLETLIQNLN